MAHDHPEPDTDRWSNPDFCPFCGAELTDPGQGFLDHVEETDTCNERFEDWRENIRDDSGSEWSS